DRREWGLSRSHSHRAIPPDQRAISEHRHRLVLRTDGTVHSTGGLRPLFLCVVAEKPPPRRGVCLASLRPQACHGFGIHRCDPRSRGNRPMSAPKTLTFVEIDIPYCALSYGVALCTATGGEKCFNTFA